jgi:hypothetical protein
MLEDLTLPKKQRPCRVRDVKAKLDEKDCAILDKLLASKDWPHKTLERSLADRGIMLGEGVIRKHRHMACGCYER